MKGNNKAEDEFDTNFSCMVGMMHAKLVIENDDDDGVESEFVSINPCNEKDTKYVRLKSSMERNIISQYNSVVVVRTTSIYCI